MHGSFPAGIADFRDGQPAQDPWVGGPSEPEQIEIVSFSPLWADRYEVLARDISGALGSAALEIDHVGSTAVPGLAAKDVIDIDLTVPDPSDESRYVPALEALGYTLRVREPEFEEHRMLRLASPRVNLHVYAPNSAEVARHRLFRDWLRRHPAERERYANAKRAAATAGPTRPMEYNAKKAIVVRELYARAFAASGIPIRARALAPDRLPELPGHVPGPRGELPGRSLSWRPATEGDVPQLAELSRVCGLLDHPRAVVTEEHIALSLRGARFDPTRDSMIAVDAAGRAVAYGEARLPEAEPAAETGGEMLEVSLEGMVHPGLRRRGVGRALLAWQEARGRQLLAESASALPAMLSLGGRVAHVGLRALAQGSGFGPVRWWYELERSLAGELPQREVPDDVRLVPFADRYSERTRAAVNDAFRDHFGFHPITRREWEDEGALAEFAPALSRLAVAGRGTLRDPHRVVGLALSEVKRAEFALRGGPFGYLSTIGVVREWRGRGLSSVLIAEVLRAYRAAGLGSAVLDVDAANPSGALGMYERLGFAERDRSVTYAKYC